MVQPKFSPWVGMTVQVLLAVIDCLNDLGMVCPSPTEGMLRFHSVHLAPQGACWLCFWIYNPTVHDCNAR